MVRSICGLHWGEFTCHRLHHALREDSVLELSGVGANFRMGSGARWRKCIVV